MSDLERLGFEVERTNGRVSVTLDAVPVTPEARSRTANRRLRVMAYMVDDDLDPATYPSDELERALVETIEGLA